MMQNHKGDLTEQIINLLRALDCQKEMAKYLIQQFYTVINIKTHQLKTFLNEDDAHHKAQSVSTKTFINLIYNIQ